MVWPISAEIALRVGVADAQAVQKTAETGLIVDRVEKRALVDM